MKGKNNLIKDIEEGNFIDSKDKDLKKHLFGILKKAGKEGLDNFSKLYAQDYEILGYNVNKVQKDVLYTWNLIKDGGNVKWQ